MMSVLCWQYPMAAGSAAERAEAGGAAMAKKRGREVRQMRSAPLPPHPSRQQEGAEVMT